jgi:hypothetical protein
MRKSKKNTTIKKNKKCVYTDETKRLIKYTKRLRQKNIKTMKNIKSK